MAGEREIVRLSQFIRCAAVPRMRCSASVRAVHVVAAQLVV